MNSLREKNIISVVFCDGPTRAQTLERHQKVVDRHKKVVERHKKVVDTGVKYPKPECLVCSALMQRNLEQMYRIPC